MVDEPWCLECSKPGKHHHDWLTRSVTVFNKDKTKCIRITNQMLESMSIAEYGEFRKQFLDPEPSTTAQVVQTAYDRTLEFSLRPAFEEYRKAIEESGGALGEDNSITPDSSKWFPSIP